jgi:hypothetical protein
MELEFAFGASGEKKLKHERSRKEGRTAKEGVKRDQSG